MSVNCSGKSTLSKKQNYPKIELRINHHLVKAFRNFFTYYLDYQICEERKDKNGEKKEVLLVNDTATSGYRSRDMGRSFFGIKYYFSTFA